MQGHAPPFACILTEHVLECVRQAVQRWTQRHCGYTAKLGSTSCYSICDLQMQKPTTMLSKSFVRLHASIRHQTAVRYRTTFDAADRGYLTSVAPCPLNGESHDCCQARCMVYRRCKPKQQDVFQVLHAMVFMLDQADDPLNSLSEQRISCSAHEEPFANIRVPQLFRH